MKHCALPTNLGLHAACFGNSLSVSFSLQFIEFRGYYFQVFNFLIAFFTYAVHLVQVLELWCFYLPAPCKSTTSQFELIVNKKKLNTLGEESNLKIEHIK